MVPLMLLPWTVAISLLITSINMESHYLHSLSQPQTMRHSASCIFIIIVIWHPKSRALQCRSSPKRLYFFYSNEPQVLLLSTPVASLFSSVPQSSSLFGSLECLLNCTSIIDLSCWLTLSGLSLAGNSLWAGCIESLYLLNGHNCWSVGADSAVLRHYRRH